ncbi:MAG: hypothetical protein K0S65_3994, partial [Labilithrix sp.]|nr:hypothetical protein [Labilithrix sp.]
TLDRIDRVTKQIDTIARADSEVPTMTWGEFTFSPELGRVAYSAAFANEGGVSSGIRSVDLASGSISTITTNSGVRNLTHVGTDLFFNAPDGPAIRRVSFDGGDVVTIGDGEIAVGSTGGWTYYLHWLDDAYALARIRESGGVPQEIARDVTRWYRRPVALDSKGGAYYVQRGTLEEPWRLLYVGPDHPFSTEILACSDVDHCGDRPTWVKLYGDHVFVGGELGSNIAYGKIMERNVPSFIQVSRFRGQSSVWFEGGYVFETYARGGYGIPLCLGCRMKRVDPGVAQFLEELDHPLKKEVIALRKTILGASAEIHEGIKWNAPSFRTTNEWFATFHLRSKEQVSVVLHLGAKVKPAATKGIAVADPSKLLVWRGKDRALVSFTDAADVKAKREAFGRVVSEWIRWV